MDWKADGKGLFVPLHRLLENSDQILDRLGRAMQIGIAAYSIALVWKLCSEISEVVSSSDGDNMEDNNADLIRKLVAIVEEKQRQQLAEETSTLFAGSSASASATTVSTATTTTTAATTTTYPKLWHSPRSRVYVDLILKLQASGMPLRAFNTTEDGSDAVSIATLLPRLTKTEIGILQQCLVDPRSIDASELVFGMGKELSDLKNVIHRLRNPSNSRFNALFGPANKPFCYPGILLYGPPGCGKSLLIRHATANANVPCLMATPSLLLRKYIGESNYQVRALFSLISKLSPCILFIDEIDGLFQERNSEEHHVLREIKTEFLQYWDGLLSNKSVLVVGATNRPFDLDAAALRRLPIYWYIDPPNADTRRRLLRHWLEKVPFENDVDIEKLVEMTDGYTPSDIRHVLQVAALEGPLEGSHVSDKISYDDLLAALSTVAGSRSSDVYSRQLYNFMQKHDGQMFRNAVVAWETPAGRFYSLGTWNMDGEVIRTIMEIVRELQDADGSEDDLDDMDDDL